MKPQKIFFYLIVIVVSVTSIGLLARKQQNTSSVGNEPITELQRLCRDGDQLACEMFSTQQEGK